MTGTSASKAHCEAMLILRQAQALGIGIATDGVEVITVAPGVPLELSNWLHVELAKRAPAVIAIIEDKNAARTGASS